MPNLSQDIQRVEQVSLLSNERVNAKLVEYNEVQAQRLGGDYSLTLIFFSFSMVYEWPTSVSDNTHFYRLSKPLERKTTERFRF